MSQAEPIFKIAAKQVGRENSQQIYIRQATNELVFAVVGHVGSGTSTIVQALASQLDRQGYDCAILKAKQEIFDWAKQQRITLPTGSTSDLKYVESLQDLGDSMRLEHDDHAAVARALVKKIRLTRAQKTGVTNPNIDPIAPDGSKRAYILDSLRHPVEVELLRRVYENAFTLIGVVCLEDVRSARIMEKYNDAGKKKALEFMRRDAKAPEKHGQRVADAFHLSDYFIDNSAERFLDDKKTQPNENWDIPEQLSRLLKIITHSEIVRPTLAETSMHAAYGAQVRSACLSRQVGACLVDTQGNIIATGTNEVPRAGGGVYKASFDQEELRLLDGRCAYSPGLKYCSNTREQNEIIDELIEEVPGMSAVGDRESLKKNLRNTRIGSLIEFSRAVHAEMETLMSAARVGISTVGTRMFVTTFPCHYCARHLISAGVDEVQYIEPYPKSQALNLHKDAIVCTPVDWTPPSRGADSAKVLFRPFTGVAPRMYVRAFRKERELKNNLTGDLKVSQAPWGEPWQIGKTSYIQLEAELAGD